MGHIRFGKMPKSRKWEQVVELLGNEYGNVASLAQATLHATKSILKALNNDVGIQNSFWVLTQLTLKAKSKEYLQALKSIGIDISPDSQDTLSFTADLSSNLTELIKKSETETVFSEIARLSCLSVISDVLSSQTPNLFGNDLSDIQDIFRTYSSKQNFAELSKNYFAEFLSRSIKYFISTEAYNHVGDKLRFKNVAELSDFENALTTYCRQSARIVQEFAGGWYSKTEYEKGIGFEEVTKFIPVALKKMYKELSLEETAP